MVKMRCVILFCFLIANSVVEGQSIENFISLEAAGQLPDDFLISSTEKSKADIASNDNKELDKNFFLSSRFFIDQLLLSGKILFNEELSNYVNKVARYTLRTEKKLYKELRFYVVKSTSVNAFSTDQGIIFFTTGLLAQLENEAQLAYIISHEVSHYTEKHVQSGYLEKKELEKGSGKYRRLEYEERVSELSIYEKDKEFEADRKGIEIYLKSEYSVNEIFNSFEMLLYSYLPFDEVKFDFNLINTEKLAIPASYFPDTTNAVSLEQDYDDANSSHPNIKKRIDEALNIVGDRESRGNLKFKISEEEFHKIQLLARFEGVNLLLAERKYPRAIYDVFLLKREHPNNRFLDLCFVKALYGLAKYKNKSRFRQVMPKVKLIEGERFPLYLFLNNLSREEINVIALRHANDMQLKYPKDQTFGLYFNDLKKEMALNSKIKYIDFKQLPFEEYKLTFEEKALEFDVQDSLAKVDASDLSKYQKIRLKKKLTEIENGLKSNGVEREFSKFALYDLVQNGLIDELDEIKQESENPSSSTNAARIEKIVVIDPIYRDYNLKSKQNFAKSERKKAGVSKAYTTSYKKLDLEVELIDSKTLNKTSVAKYNELGLVFSWFTEVFAHDGMDMISSSHDRMQVIKEKYGSNHLLFTGIFSYKARNEPSANHLIWAMTGYGLPFALIDLAIIHNYFDMVSLLADIDSDKVVFSESTEVNLKGTAKILDAYIYDVLHQIKNLENK